ncbi:phosphotransferase [Ectothiorhodospiraceae bacterium 2226]|nr:phosphotransferase [Ectothiorhodospiraceae bacterium 2226]
MDERFDALTRWLREDLRLPAFDIAPASSDASFRRYFRVGYTAAGAAVTRIAMDAPPPQEDVGPFIHTAALLGDMGLNAPRVLAAAPEQGFLLLTDLGNRPYLDALDEDSVERLYGDALGALCTLQAQGPRADGALPSYDRTLLLTEMGLFREWYLQRHLDIALSDAEERGLERIFAFLADAALEQPRVCVHRDYHSRNLMVCEGHNPGILDFQDAVIGPLTYDLVSLLRDCYIAWPRARVEAWALGYRTLLLRREVLSEEAADEARFLRWFDLMGVQRHLKAAGIFARLNARDGKPGYLKDIPRTLGYVVEVAGRYPELAPLAALLARTDQEASACAP